MNNLACVRFYLAIVGYIELTSISMLILNIDDDVEDREMFREAIRAVDPVISCIQHESGLNALEFIADSEIVPDYIFIDINMPKMNGYECVKEIRLLPGTKKIPIIMYSTAFNPNDQVDFKKLGIKYLTKSSRFSELVESIKNLIGNRVKVLEGKSKK